jgi:hypothetical protein
MTRARAELSTVPNARAAMPNTCPPFGSQTRSVKKLPSLACSAGMASAMRKTAMAAMIPSRTMPEPVAR